MFDNMQCFSEFEYLLGTQASRLILQIKWLQNHPKIRKKIIERQKPFIFFLITFHLSIFFHTLHWSHGVLFLLMNHLLVLLGKLSISQIIVTNQQKSVSFFVELQLLVRIYCLFNDGIDLNKFSSKFRIKENLTVYFPVTTEFVATRLKLVQLPLKSWLPFFMNFNKLYLQTKYHISLCSSFLEMVTAVFNSEPYHPIRWNKLFKSLCIIFWPYRQLDLASFNSGFV